MDKIKDNMKEILIVWAIFVFSVIYWDVNIRYEEKEPLSKCHEAKVKEYKNRYLLLMKMGI